jgi:hypothetical protein
MNHKPDEVDLWGIGWARQRRIMLGIITACALTPEERLGKLRCTLGQIQEDRVGAGERSRRVGENGHPDQDWPEVYTGMSLIVHQAYMKMPGNHRIMMNLHYVWREIPVRLRAREVDVSVAQYWIQVSVMKGFLHGAVLAGSRNFPSRRSILRNSRTPGLQTL